MRMVDESSIPKKQKRTIDYSTPAPNEIENWEKVKVNWWIKLRKKLKVKINLWEKQNG